MKLLIAVAPERFRDEELSKPMKVFATNNVGTTIGSTEVGECLGMLGDRVMATVTFDQISAADYDGIVIVGGIGSQDYFWSSRALIECVNEFYQGGRVVAAICLSPVVLALAGILKGRRATVFASPASTEIMKKSGAKLQAEPVVIDGRIITANGPAAAEAFGHAIIEVLRQ